MSDENNNENLQENSENQENTEHKEQTQETQEQAVQDTAKKSKRDEIIRLILILIAVFMGTFAAVYTIIDLNMYKLGMKPFMRPAPDIRCMMKKEADFINQMERQERKSPIKIETEDDKYVVKVHLRAFDNNPENVKIQIAENGIKIKGISARNKHGEMQERAFFQNVIFPNKIDETAVQKNIDGDEMTITLPFKE